MMDVNHIETVPFYENIQAKAADSFVSRIEMGLATILRNPSHHNYIIRTNKGFVEFDFRSRQDKENVNSCFFQGRSHICNVKSVSHDGSFIFDFYVFAGSVDDFGDVVILAEEEKLGKLQGKKSSIEECRKKLAENCTIKLNGESYFIMQGDYEPPKDDEEDAEHDETRKAELGGAFSILCNHFGKCYAVKVQQKCLSSTGTAKYFTVTGTSPRKNIRPACNFHLIKANLTFSDQRTEASEYNIEKLKNLIEKSGSYLKAWREYTAARGNRILAQARKFGTLHYDKFTPISENSVKLYFKDNISNKIRESSVEDLILSPNSKELPLFLQDEKCDFLDYCEKKYLAEKERKEKEKNKKLLKIMKLFVLLLIIRTTGFRF